MWSVLWELSHVETKVSPDNHSVVMHPWFMDFAFHNSTPVECLLRSIDYQRIICLLLMFYSFFSPYEYACFYSNFMHVVPFCTLKIYSCIYIPLNRCFCTFADFVLLFSCILHECTLNMFWSILALIYSYTHILQLLLLQSWLH